jgi:hypothetical protein
MRGVDWRWIAALTAAVCLLPSVQAADEAQCADGRRVSGTLVLEKDRLHFRSVQGEAIPITEITRVRLDRGMPTPFRIGDGRRVHLRDGQRITGRILGLSEDTLTLRTAWADRIRLPRSAVASIDPLPGWRLLAHEDFHAGWGAFKTAGDPALADAGAGSVATAVVVLGTLGQRVEYTPGQSLKAGRVGINFEEWGKGQAARGTLELTWAAGARPQRLTVTVAGEGEHYTVTAEGVKGMVRQVPRTPGWHRLIVSFSKHSLRLTCDDKVLWYNVEEGVGGPLKQVTIACHLLARIDEALPGPVAWTEFALERAVDEHPRPTVEAEQDEVRFSSDDQLFGRISQADRRTLQIEGRFGKRSLPWTRLAGCTFRLTAPPSPRELANVRIQVDSGLCPEADVLEGVVTSLDPRRLVLRHALLGEIALERGRVRQLQPLSGASK